MQTRVFRRLPGTLYSAVTMELFERLAYYGMVLVLGIYLVQHIGIRPDLYGTVFGLFTGALYLLPLFAGALADRFGYKPALIVAFATLTGGYALLGSARSFGPICVALGLIAIGGSIIKPTVSGTVTRTTEEGSTRPVGFGLYYMMINAGGLIGPVLAAQVRNRTEFRYVFFVSAAACALMFVQALVAFREPVTAAERRTGKGIGRVLADMLLVLGNWRFVLLLVIFSGFWGMMDVLFGFVPLFVDAFSNLPALEAAIDRVVPLTRLVGHWLNPEVFVSLDALLIVILQAGVSYLTRRWRTLTAMLVGTAISTLAWVAPALSPGAGVVALGIFVWSAGEMVCSARFFEYCGTIAPRGQVAVYLGYSFFAIFLGNLYAGPWAGFLYQRHVTDRVAAHLAPQFIPFFGGVMLMGVLSVVGLVLYGALVAPARDSEGEVSAR
jgi:proton-dependent oligopeptide transporter, POT family